MQKKAAAVTIPLSGYQVLVIVMLALTQFTVVLDFMVMSPLGDMLMKSMKLESDQFGFVVSSYAFSAGISGLLTAGFADRFDRKKLLLVFMWGLSWARFYADLPIRILYWLRPESSQVFSEE